ncbi:EcsC family protein [Texcoconibacillus texcoconensis]|uniref:EcsC family protein n=1 Tax=Texcoconibacillus texcoconensis TaxID=1095777 RepID=A0A840QPD8_9BACI|nr:EcsC family protein [Texcoconibacillus texcoconensis]MBB5173230.1 hypothetical protein [Texcoconibacillus texcoconensis]
MQASSYEQKAKRELERWQHRLHRSPSLPNQVVKRWQKKINEMMPKRVHATVSEAVKQMVRMTLTGAQWTSNQTLLVGDETLEEREMKVEELRAFYKRTAAVEGAGTGFGGIVLGLADFPLFLAIKMKLLSDTAKAYGRDVNLIEERVFMLLVFQLTFAKPENRTAVYERLCHWEEEASRIREKQDYIGEIDWTDFQLDYRDTIDLPKMLQMIPGFGAAVGAVANRHYVDVLADRAINAYRLRWFEELKGRKG